MSDAPLPSIVGDTILSSRFTFVAKIVLPVAWIGIFGGVTIALWTAANAPIQMRWTFLAVWIVGTVAFFWTSLPLKRVRVSGGNLYVSNYREEISVPLAAVSRVTENRWINIHPVTIHLRYETPFGDSIKFMPKARMAFNWTSHPVVNELTQMAKAAAAAAARSRE